MVQYMLTTFDNPFDPFDDFTKWFLWDTEKGYNSCAYLARVVAAFDSDSSAVDNEENENEVIEQAIDSIIECDFMNVYCKARKSDGKLEFVDVNRENATIAANVVNAVS